MGGLPHPLQRALLIYLKTHSDWSGLLGISNAVLMPTQTRKPLNPRIFMRHRVSAGGTLQRNNFLAGLRYIKAPASQFDMNC
jgi:hypothetical protein